MALGLLAPKSDMINVMFCLVFRCDLLKLAIQPLMFAKAAAEKTVAKTPHDRHSHAMKHIRSFFCVEA